jgi:hypothetical protein
LLNAEVEKAASELAESLGEGNYAGEAVASDDDNAGRVVGSEDDTSIEMQLTNLSELDLTATLEAQNDEIGDDRRDAARQGRRPGPLVPPESSPTRGALLPRLVSDRLYRRSGHR